MHKTTALVNAKLCKIQKVVNFIHFNQKTPTSIFAKLCLYIKVLQ